MTIKRSVDIPVFDALALENESTNIQNAFTGNKEKQRTYRNIMRFMNHHSYSNRTTLQDCPREFLLNKLTANVSGSGEQDEINIDFIFGEVVSVLSLIHI